MKYNNKEYIIMGTNHNRIKVVDLEENQPNKILNTNTNGDLKLDNTTFPDMINTSTDSEGHVTATVSKETKVTNGLKLSNWWKWIRFLLLKWYHTTTTLIGTKTAPMLIIQNKTLTTISQNDTAKRDSHEKL